MSEIRDEALKGYTGIDLETRKAVWSMLIENTGRNLVDSGGDNGRAWQRNQNVNFEAQPVSWIEVYSTEIGVMRSLYHWMVSNLVYEEAMTRELMDLVNEEGEVYETTGEFMESLGGEEYLGAKPGYEHDYTYNLGGTLMTQDIQWWATQVGEEVYLAIQVHGGADARWGFTDPVVFRWDKKREFENFYYDFLNRSCYSGDTGLYWDSEGRPSYLDGEEVDDEKALDRYEVSTDPRDRGRGKVYVNLETKEAFCPITGAKLYPSQDY